MVGFDEPELNALLRSRLSYSDSQARHALNALQRLPDALQEHLTAWIKNGETRPHTFRTVTLDRIKAKMKCDYIQALIYMGILIRDPELADHFESMRRLIR